jgi:hypothetical protein
MLKKIAKYKKNKSAPINRGKFYSYSITHSVDAVKLLLLQGLHKITTSHYY